MPFFKASILVPYPVAISRLAVFSQSQTGLTPAHGFTHQAMAISANDS
jgi:hypothetical protein